jgi:hypothetical protein
MNAPTIHERARWAKNALAVFTAETSNGGHPDTMHPDDVESAITDLICDLMYFAEQQGFGPIAVIDLAFEHYEVETEPPV